MLSKIRQLKVITYVFSLIFLLSFTNPVLANECNTGGEGSSSCTDSGTISYGWFVFSFEVSYENSVSCDDGYYACCNSDGASCIAE